MLSHSAIRGRLDLLRDPLTLCQQLNLRPKPEQFALLQRLALKEPVVMVKGDAESETMRAVAIGALWRILDTPSGSGVLIASKQELAVEFMEFIEIVCARINPAIKAVTSFPRWGILRIGGQPGWELRFLPNHTEIVASRARDAVVSVVLGAKSTEIEFGAALEALREHSKHPRHTRIEVW